MLKNYLKIALRNLTRFKIYSFINIFGLAVGMAVCILIFLYVSDELSYDKYHEKKDRIFRVSREWFDSEGKTNLHLGHVAPAAAPLLENDFPGIVEHAIRVLDGGSSLMEADKKLYERIHFADDDFFNVFTIKMLEGDPNTALRQPNSVVLTTAASQRMFGNENPLNKTIRFDDQVDLKVTGLTEEVPVNSHFHYDYLVSFNVVEDFYGKENLMKNWGNNSYSTYLLLKEGYDPKELEAQLPSFLDKHMGEFQSVPVSQGTRLHLWPITDVHLYSNLDSEAEPNGKIEHIYIYSIIGIFILLIACINFMNLATARSSRRGKEVGLRKVMGAYKQSLVKQFLAESFLITLLSLLVALIIVLISLPFLNNFIGKELAFNPNIFNILTILAITLGVGLIAGSYPAFFLSSFEPAAVLKGIYKSGNQQPLFRSALVILQFTISIVLIAGMIIVYEQLQYVKSKDLGFNKQNLLVLPSGEKIEEQYESIKARLLNHPNIKNVTTTTRVPSGRLLDSGDAKVEIDGEIKQINFRLADVSVDHTFLSTLEIPLVAGRDFNQNLASDSLEAFIINESAVYAIGYTSPDQIIGKELHYRDRKGKVIGVCKNFHFESLHQSIAPIIFQIVRDRIPGLVVRLEETDKFQTLSWLEDQWAYLRPDLPFNYYFVEDRFLDQYTSEEKLGKLIGVFSTIAIIIASLGLLGLASFTTEQRTREIGIRKVLGASVTEILFLLIKGFTKLVFIAFVIACPLAFYGMHKWLQNFAYYQTLDWQPFFIAGLFALVIALGTVAFLSIKASLANPVNSIKTE